MKLKKLTIDELESLSYDEVAYLILRESGKKMKTMALYQKVCKTLKTELETDKIADFFELLSVNKKFIMLEKGYWDLQSKHKTKIIIEDDDTEEIVGTFDEEEMEEDEDDDEEDEKIFYENDEDDVVDDNELAGFIVIEDEEETS